MPDWQELLKREGPAVWRTVFRLLGNRADVDECFQEVFLAALECSRRQEVRNWAALLHRLAAARAVDRLRARCRRDRREASADWSTVAGREPIPLQSAEEAELSERLREALARIPAQQAEVFCLHCLDGWTYQETAEQLGITVDAVGVLLHRARQRLRVLLAADLTPVPRKKAP